MYAADGVCMYVNAYGFLGRYYLYAAFPFQTANLFSFGARKTRTMAQVYFSVCFGEHLG